MDVSVILTYRCNSTCRMCRCWKNPTRAQDEIPLDTLAKIPGGITYLNLTGGEPTLRGDLEQIVDLLAPRAMQLEISSNGTHPERLEPVIRRHPGTKIRFSLEGFEATNFSIRGEKDGFQRKVEGLRRLRELGGQDLGLAITIQDGNVDDLVPLFEFAAENGFELATSTLHNGFQFHKADNHLADPVGVARTIERLIIAQLTSGSVKNWFRAYLNLGLIRKVLGQERILPCTAARDFVFIDPWADVYACNVRPDLRLGSLEQDSWEELFRGPQVAEVRSQVSRCTQNCWMVGSAKTAMRQPHFARLPRLRPLAWVLENRLRVLLHLAVNFEKDGNFSRIRQGGMVTQGQFYCEVVNQGHYQGGYFNQ